MDILYYSNYCAHSQKIIQYIGKNNLGDKLNCICIDKRGRDPTTNQMTIHLENGKRVIIPPNVHSVPALLLIKQNYNAIFGNDIIQYLEPKIQRQKESAIQSMGGEPMGFTLSSSNAGTNITSEQYTFYDMTPDELSTKGRGGQRQMYNYVSANDGPKFIQTPPDTYRPDKIESSITLDSLENKRKEDIQQTSGNIPNSLFL
jgi:hypothetical protein